MRKRHGKKRMRMRGPVTVPPSRSRAVLMLAVSSCCERTSQSSAIMARATPRMLAATHQSVETRISQRHVSRTGEALSPACRRPRSSSLRTNDMTWTALERRDRIGSPRIRRRGGRAARAAASRIARVSPVGRRPSRGARRDVWRYAKLINFVCRTCAAKF